MSRTRTGRVRVSAWLAVTLLASLPVGCASVSPQQRAFPATWPGSRQLGQDAPTLSVLPLAIETLEGTPELGMEDGLPSAAVLTALLIKNLKVSGVNAIMEPSAESTAPYVLACRVPQLGYQLRSGMPRARVYDAQLVCVVRDGRTQEAVWERTLAQRYEQTVVLDLMTKLPPQPHADDRLLYRECIVPLWDAMAASVGTVLTTRQAPRVLPRTDAAGVPPTNLN